MDTKNRIAAINANANWLEANGFADGARMCSPPGVGIRSEEVLDIIDSLIEIPGGFNASESLIDNLWDVKSLYVNITPGSLSDGLLSSYLINAISGKAVLNELWHDPYRGYNGSKEMWEKHIDDIKRAIDAGLLEAVTPFQIWNCQICLENNRKTSAAFRKYKHSNKF